MKQPLKQTLWVPKVGSAMNVLLGTFTFTLKTWWFNQAEVEEEDADIIYLLLGRWSLIWEVSGSSWVGVRQKNGPVERWCIKACQYSVWCMCPKDCNYLFWCAGFRHVLAKTYLPGVFSNKNQPRRCPRFWWWRWFGSFARGCITVPLLLKKPNHPEGGKETYFHVPCYFSRFFL